jgi:secreted trypsin-like serine protease
MVCFGKSLLLTALLLVCGCAHLVSGQVTCGLPEPGNRVDAQIIGGELTEPDVWPWQLSVEEDDGFSRNLVCGGAIIGPNWAVTAAQCVFNKTSQLVAIAGMYRRSDPLDDARQLRILNDDDIIIHPNFNPESLLHDLALLRFDDPYDFTLPSIRPICLPPTNDTSYVQNPNCFVTGWGVTEVGGEYSDELLRTGIDVIGDVNCQIIINRVVLRTEQCGFDQVSRTTGPCHGDFGGPLSCLVDANFFLGGVVSLVTPDCYGRIPQIFTNLPYYLPWIEENINAPPAGGK